MARTAIGVSTSAITWEPMESDIDLSETGEATIVVIGKVDSRNTSLWSALSLVPSTVPISPTGPIGNATDLSGAKLSSKSGNGEECFWSIRATYKKSLAQTADYDGTQRSDNDRAERRVVVVEEPILSHPVARAFSIQSRNRLNALLSGVIIPNPEYGGDGETAEDEFLAEDPDTGKFTVPIEFESATETSDGVTASPIDYARLIKAGITSYSRKTVRHVWSTSRNNPATSSEYRAVGKIVSSPPLAPSLASGFQWMQTGIIDRTENGDTWNTDYEFDASGAGGFLAPIYAGGNATISA